MASGNPIVHLQAQYKELEGGFRSWLAAAAQPLASGNPIEHLQAQYKELEGGFRSWLATQPLAVEAAVVTGTTGLQGAAMGALMGTLNVSDAAIPTPPPGAALTPQAMESLKQAQAFAGGPLVQARNFAVMTGTNAGIACVMKRVRGVDDIQNSVVAAFGSGAMFSLVSGMGGPNQALNAITSGAFFALVQGAIYMVGDKFKSSTSEDANYYRTKSLLTSLGLQNYEKNFKKGLLTDATLPLLTDSALRDARIPPGPRLRILDHIRRDPELVKRS